MSRVFGARGLTRCRWLRFEGCCEVPHQGVVLRGGSAARHVSAPVGAHGAIGPRPGWAQSVSRLATSGGGHAAPSSQPGRVRASRGGPLREAADLAVAQAVVDERETLRAIATRALFLPRRLAILRYCASSTSPP